jgi:hypothetical protein
LLALPTLDDAAARPKKRLKPRPPASGAVQYIDGTPIIMQGYRPAPSVLRDAGTPRAREDLPRPPGSSSYVPPPVPAPGPSGSTMRALPPAIYQPPPVNSFSDRVRNCIHSYPLNAGVGNNPAGRDAYVSHCAN